jgi:hypothetical protein
MMSFLFVMLFLFSIAIFTPLVIEILNKKETDHRLTSKRSKR